MTTTGWAVVTGASRGLGRGFATMFAADGMPVMLVARNAAQLYALADDLRSRYGVEVMVRVCDLSDDTARQSLVADLATRPVRVLVNNAGIGSLQPFAGSDPLRMTQEVQLNCLGATALALAVIGPMTARGAGTIINVASTAAFQPVPTMAVYAATKAYLLHFSLALSRELGGTGVTVLALCPGPTATDFFAAAGQDPVSGCRTVEQVIETLTTALEARAPLAIDGRFHAVVSRIAARLPMPLVLPFGRAVARAEWLLRGLPGHHETSRSSVGVARRGKPWDHPLGSRHDDGLGSGDGRFGRPRTWVRDEAGGRRDAAGTGGAERGRAARPG